jgi:NADH:ubiquinone oxidoreductase subunit H
MRLCWKFFLPIALGCLVWAAAWVGVFAPMFGGRK